MQATPTSSLPALLRATTFLGAAAVLSACASHTTTAPMTATQEAATYVARAKPSYAPPGPPEDPWGPYIGEASKKFDVPERWIREVMRVESGGHEFRASGVLITSPVGAMGLMQLMPATYDEVRARYGLSDDAFDPHNNIMAGTAYLREMYDAFGSPGMLAAYNGGPARLQDYLTHNRPLPAETRRYVAMIAPYIRDEWPQARSPAEQYAVNQLPDEIPAGPRYPRHVTITIAARGHRGHEAYVRYASAARRGRAQALPVEVAEAPEIRFSSHGSWRMASAAMPVRHGIHVIEHAGAAAPVQHLTVRVRGLVASSHVTHAAVYRAHAVAPVHAAAAHGCRKSAHGRCTT